MILFRAVLWKSLILEKINNSLASTQWSITSVDLSGHLLSSIHAFDVTAVHPEFDTLYIKQSTLNLGFISTIFKRLTFDLIEVKGLETSLITEDFYSDYARLDYDRLKPSFNINHFFISGSVPVRVRDSIYVLSGMVEGKLTSGEILQIDLSKLKLKIDEPDPFNITLENVNFIADRQGLFIQEFDGKIGQVPLTGFVKYLPDSSIFSGSITMNEFLISKELFSRTPLKGKFSSLSGQFDFKSDLGITKGDLSISNNLGLAMEGDFNLLHQSPNWILRSLKLSGEDSRLHLNGSWEENGRVSGYFYLDSLDLSRWLMHQKPTLLSGMMILEGSLDQNNALDQIELTLEVLESKLYPGRESSFHGTVSYLDSIIYAVDPVMLIIGESILSLNGSVDFKTNELDLVADLENADVELVNKFWVDSFSSGWATGRMQIRGTIDTPNAVADLQCRDIIYHDFSLSSLSFHSEMETRDAFPSGFVNLKIEQGKWRDKQFESGTVDISFARNRMVVENCHFKSGDDFLQISGSWLSADQYKLDRFQLAYEGNYLINSKPIFLMFQDSVVVVEPFEFHINDGILDGVLEWGNHPEGRLKMSNFDAEVITQFLDDQRLQFSGIIFGEVWFQFAADASAIDIDISLKRGKYMGEAFDEMTMSFLYKDGLLHIDDISMTRGESMGFQTSGIVPIRTAPHVSTQISMHSTFRELSMPMVHRFIPGFYQLGGNASGTFTLSGSTDLTLFSFNADIKEAQFDRIYLGTVKGKGQYTGRRLIIDEAESQNEDEFIKAYGSVPLDLNLSSENYGLFFENDTLDFHTEGTLHSLPFLSPYLAELDSVTGDFDISLSLTGPAYAIMRDGYVRVQDAAVYTMLLNDPIISLNGEATMQNNQMKIKSLLGKAVNYNDRDSWPSAPNVALTGAIDFSRFFQPDYHLKVDQIEDTEIYFKALPIDVSGTVGDLDLTIYGRDTVEIVGKIEALDVIIFYEFTTEDVGVALPENEGIIMSYRLNVPIRGQGKFQNSQVDALLVGEISLSKIGNQYWNFGGELFVEDGTVFSYKDNFEDLQGYVSFDNNGVNPYMDVSAFTMIDNERIELRITGDIDDMDLRLESSSGFSESDILELLTWGKRFEDQEMTSTGFGSQAYSVLGSLLESQLEKNLKEITALGIMNLVDDIDITGTAGLLNPGAGDDFQISAKRKFGDKTYLNLSYRRSFSLTIPAQTQIGVEYKLNRNLSLVGNVDDQGHLNLKYRYRYAY
ncbi:MAG TPA: hypothetical protein EYO45_06850 [Candidatus Marinimicrobia bacterium]|nr:hypothetical protein [Candidatus Neomarinimicrobiota bacterium]